MTQYLLSVYPDPSVFTMSEEELAPMFAATDAFNDELKAAGSFVFAGGLHPAESATVVDATGAGVTVTDVGSRSSRGVAGRRTFCGFWASEGDRAVSPLSIDSGGRGGSVDRADVGRSRTCSPMLGVSGRDGLATASGAEAGRRRVSASVGSTAAASTG